MENINVTVNESTEEVNITVSEGGGGGAGSHTHSNMSVLNATEEPYTTIEKNKLAGISGTNTGDQDLTPYATTSSVNTDLANKVDKVSGRGLSEQNFSTVDKAKLDSLSNYAGFRGAQSSLANIISAYPTGTIGDWAIITNTSGNAYFAIWDTDIPGWVEAGQSPTIPGTNLNYTVLGNTLTITSDTGTDVTIPLATSSDSGLMSKEDKSKIDSMTAVFTSLLKTAYDGVVIALNALLATGQRLITNNEINKISFYVTPEEYGAVGDGSTNDAVAFQSAINSGLPIFLGKKNYRISTTLTTGSNMCLIGSGKGTILSTTSNIAIISITGDYNTIRDIQFLGNNTGTSQNGISCIGAVALTTYRLANLINGCWFTNLSGNGIVGQYMIGSASGSNHEGSMMVSDCTVDNCNFGINFGLRAEYCCINNCNVFNSTTGVSITGGNNSIIGGQITGCTTGLQLLPGANGAHCVASSVKINHNTTNIACSQGLIYTFSGCQIYAGHLVFTGTGKNKFVGCDFGYSGGNLTITNSPVFFTDCDFSDLPGTFTLTGAQPYFSNCYTGTSMLVHPNRTFPPSATYAANGTLLVPMGCSIQSITILNTTANAITGGLRIGTTSGASDVVASIAVPANGIIEVNNADILKKIFSNTANQTLHIQAVTAWNSASIRFNIRLQQNVFIP